MNTEDYDFDFSLLEELEEFDLKNEHNRVQTFFKGPEKLEDSYFNCYIEEVWREEALQKSFSSLLLKDTFQDCGDVDNE